jgi:hypothetical protein
MQYLEQVLTSGYAGDFSNLLDRLRKPIQSGCRTVSADSAIVSRVSNLSDKLWSHTVNSRS